MSHKLFDLTGRTAVVIGGTSGIGRTLALGFAEAGANTVATGRRQELVHTVQQEIEGFGVRSLGASCDVSSAESVQEFASQVVSKNGSYYYSSQDIIQKLNSQNLNCPNLDVIVRNPTNSGVYDYKYPGYYYDVNIPYLPSL